MAKPGFLRLASLCAMLLSFAMHAALAQERFTREVNFNIAAQSVEAALIEFSKQADVQVMVGGALNGQKTDGVKGRLSVTDGLRLLLKDTGLEYQAEGNTVTIRSVRNARADTKVRPLLEGARLASNGAAEEAARSGGKADDDASTEPTETLGEVLVTGTYIHGANSITPVMTFSTVDIERTGFATSQDWLEALPQNFGGGQSEEAGGIGNFNGGTSVNLRGLGSGTTLVLVNGRRQPASGLNGDFVDISSIPIRAVERVEILTDGASALYGSDAIGGVVNFILRKDFEGAETSARYGVADGGADETVAAQLLGYSWATGNVLLDYQYYKRSALMAADRSFSRTADRRPDGGNDFRSVNSNPGNIFVNFAPAYAIPRGQDGTNLTAADLLPGVINFQEPLEGSSLLPERDMHSVFLTVSQDVSESWQLFAEGRYTVRDGLNLVPAFDFPLTVPDTNPFFVSPVPGATSVDVGYNFFDDYGPTINKGKTETYVAAAGATWAPFADWAVTFSGSLGRETLDFSAPTMDFGALFAALADTNPATAFNPFGDGSHTNPATLAAIRRMQIENGVSDISNVNVIADGTLFHLPGGAAKLAVGADYRKEELARGTLTRLEYDRNVTAAFFELSLPLVSQLNRRAGIEGLQLSGAARYEKYSDFGDTFNPKLSLSYSPVDHVNVHASWGTSFRAPTLFDLDDVTGTFNAVSVFPFPDPQSPLGFSQVIFRSGGNSNLTDETATTWTTGVSFDWGRSSQLTLLYYNIDYKDRIVTPGPASIFDVLFDEQQWASIITRDPTPEELAEVCGDPNLRGPVATCLAAGPIVDARKRNISETSVSGIDLRFDHVMPTEYGMFGISLNGTYVLDYENTPTPTSETIDVVDTINNPVSLRLRATGSWAYAGFDTSLSVNHIGAYTDDTGAQRRDVDAWNTLDVRFAYTAQQAGWLHGMEVALSASNVLDEDPPIVNRGLGYDSVNAAPLGRFVAIQLTKGWGQ